MTKKKGDSEQARKTALADEILRLKYSIPTVKQETPTSKIYAEIRHKRHKRLSAAVPASEDVRRDKDVFVNHIQRERKELKSLSIEELSVILDEIRTKANDRKEDSHKATGEPPQGEARDNSLLHELRSMQNLTADELTITFVAGEMLEITARDVTKRVPLAFLDLVDRRKGGLTKQGGILLGFAQGKRLTRDDRVAQRISRLRGIFKQHLGITADPFHSYRGGGAGWEPRFKVKDNRRAADERAQRSAHHVPLYETDNDEAGKWLRNQGRKDLK